MTLKGHVHTPLQALYIWNSPSSFANNLDEDWKSGGIFGISGQFGRRSFCLGSCLLSLHVPEWQERINLNFSSCILLFFTTMYTFQYRQQSNNLALPGNTIYHGHRTFKRRFLRFRAGSTFSLALRLISVHCTGQFLTSWQHSLSHSRVILLTNNVSGPLGNKLYSPIGSEQYSKINWRITKCFWD